MRGREPVLVAEAITKRFGGVAALNDVTFTARAGEVHCLAGENGSGKSTLIKIIAGVTRPDTGTITVAGQAHDHLSPRRAIDLGIEVIFQDFSLFPNLTVAENIGLASVVGSRRRTVNPREVRRVAAGAVARIGARLDLDARVEDLSVADRQLTAICRALARDARIIFMDEPTTALTWREVESFFTVVEALRERGVALVFVSHKLDAVLRISQSITVLRNGEVSATGEVADFDRAAIARAMTGRDLVDMTPEGAPATADAPPLLEVEGLGRDGAFEDVSFALAPGEILGVTGLLGSGRTEIAEALFGLAPADRGTVRVEGRPVRVRSMRDAMEAGIGYVPSDRLTQGAFLDQSIADNIVAGSVDLHVGRFGFLRRDEAAATVERAFEDLRIKAPSPAAPVRSLSGGNQQRVVLAKWLARAPRILLLNSPTVGVDVGSKQEILEILRERAAGGMGIVIISDDVTELLAVCQRLLFVRGGRISRTMAGAELDASSVVQELVA
jgi:simple sugar transport system ATP-binding protein